MAKIISFANQKGGVAKTTSSFNIAVGLAQRGFKVLAVDLDPQASLTIYAGLEPYAFEKSIVDVLRNPEEKIKDCVCDLRKNLHILTSRIELANVENELLGRMGREFVLGRALKSVDLEYDYIVIDCPPQLSTLTINALACTDKLIIPCKTDYLAYRGLEYLLSTVNVIREHFKTDIEVLGVLATLFDSRVKDDKEILELLQEEHIVIGVIKRAAQAKKGMYDGKASIEYLPNSDISKEYEKVIDLILK